MKQLFKMFSVCVVGSLLLSCCSMAHAAYVVVGSLQSEQGDPSDWDPPNSSLIMTDTAGVHTVSASNLDNGITKYEFKILDDEGTAPANWGDPEITPANVMAYGDADGTITITADTTKGNNNAGWSAHVWVNSDGIPLQVVGDFMDEAGGAGDWDPFDSSFAMTSNGGGYYTFDATISTPGSYQFKATDSTGWDWQVGPDGFSNNASTHSFSTSAPNETVTMFINVANQTIGIVPEPATFLLGLGSVLAVVGLRRR